MVNGSPTAEFIPQRGLKQGDPLAPFLFNIVVEGLTGLMREAQEKNLFEGYKVQEKYYANDTIFFGTATWENIRAIKVMLRSFELVSRLKINFAKSRFGAIGETEQWILNAATFLNCKVLLLPFSYLGIPIGANPRRSETWDSVVKKCEKTIKVETKISLFWGKGNSNKVSPELDPYLFFSPFSGCRRKWWTN